MSPPRRRSRVRTPPADAPAANEEQKPQPPPPPRVHLLGLGAIGSLLTFALRTSRPPVPVTALLRSRARLGAFHVLNRRIVFHPPPAAATTPADAAPLPPRVYSAGHIDPHDVNTYAEHAENPAIKHLLVSTKAQDTVAALRPLLPRLTPATTILLLQNGMGVEEELGRLWAAGPRPRVLSAVVTHGVKFRGENEIELAGREGTITVGVDGPSELVEVLRAAPWLNVRAVSEQEVFLAKLEKLVVNAGINPLTVLMNCSNGELLTNGADTVMRAVAGECSRVLERVLERRGMWGRAAEERFAADALYARIVGVARETASNTSSMLQDVCRKQETEIEYINGYIVRKGAEVGVGTPVNRELVEKVTARLPRHLKKRNAKL